MSPSTSIDFGDLSRELDRWAEEGRVASFWWRDDDAVAATPALARLLDLSDAHAIEVAVAVVPAKAEAALGNALRERRQAAILQHGFAHRNHARPGEPAVECGGERPVEEVLGEFAEGRRHLQEMLGVRFTPIMAAPWNRMERRVLERLPEAGFCGASASGPRERMGVAPGLAIANVHVDPINWRERRFAGVSKALSGILGELSARRRGATEEGEPIGLLTHHLDHDAGLWDFLEVFFALTTGHPAARWITVAEAFGASAENATSIASVR